MIEYDEDIDRDIRADLLEEEPLTLECNEDVDLEAEKAVQLEVFKT